MPPSVTTHSVYSSTHSRPIGSVSVQPPRFKLVSLPSRRLSSRTIKKLVMTTGKPTPTASHSWDKSTLHSLGVDFQPDSDFVNFVLPENITGDVKEIVAGELERVNNGEDITPDFRFDPINVSLPWDDSTLHSPTGPPSSDVVRLPRTLLKPSPITTPPTQITTPLEPPNPAVTTPLTNPSNLRYSTSSYESGPEASPNSFAVDFLEATFSVGITSVDTRSIQSDSPVSSVYVVHVRTSDELCHLYLRANRSARQAMRFKLGTQTIRAITDGGLSLYTDPNSSDCYPILCIEAKRQKYVERHRMSTDYKHAAQIYAQMLGMVCDEKLYANRAAGQPDHQEAFILHLRHATFYIFRAQFPNSYPQSVSGLGSQYRAVETQKVVLQRSPPYRMRKPADQAAFYRILVRLLYLFSGSSKVGHLNMDLWNPLFRRIHGLQKPEIQECIAVNAGLSPSKDENHFDPYEWEWSPNLEQNDRPQSNSSTLAQHGSPMRE